MDGKRDRLDGVNLLCAGARSFSEVAAIGNPLIYTSSHDHHDLASLPSSSSPMCETSSSAGSSPPACPIDSSPPSSPNNRDYDSLEDRELEYSDPYAASTHAKRRFRPYEKKPVTVVSLDTSSYGPTCYRALDEESTTVGTSCQILRLMRAKIATGTSVGSEPSSECPQDIWTPWKEERQWN